MPREAVNYEDRIAAEKAFFESCTNVHELPDIFHYWSDGKIRPQQEVFGFSNPIRMFEKNLAEHCERGRGRAQRFISIGSGNCDFEIELARSLLARGHQSFVIECLDLNPAMLERFNYLYEAAKCNLNLTEDHNYYIDQMGVQVFRLPFLEIGRRLVERGRMSRPDSVFMLYIDEVRRWTPLPETADELCEVARRLAVPDSEILLANGGPKDI
jgi:hypothetical protein